MTQKLYDTTKWTALVLFPALTALWLTTANVWQLSHISEVAFTLSAIDAFLGALVGASSAANTAAANQAKPEAPKPVSTATEPTQFGDTNQPLMPSDAMGA